MFWSGIKPRVKGEGWRDCFAWVPRRVAQTVDGAWVWAWLEPYRERLVESRWIPGGGAAFDFQREFNGSIVSFTVYDDC